MGRSLKTYSFNCYTLFMSLPCLLLLLDIFLRGTSKQEGRDHSCHFPLPLVLVLFIDFTWLQDNIASPSFQWTFFKKQKCGGTIYAKRGSFSPTVHNSQLQDRYFPTVISTPASESYTFVCIGVIHKTIPCMYSSGKRWPECAFLGVWERITLYISDINNGQWSFLG